MAGFTNVGMLTARSTYRQFDFQNMDTGLPPSENEFQFLIAQDGSNDLFVIKKSGTDTLRTEVHVFAGSTNGRMFFHAFPYQTPILQTGTILPETDHLWTFALGFNRDLFAIRRPDHSSEQAQLHVLSHESKYSQYRNRVRILPGEHKLGHDYAFLVDSNDDLWAIKKQRSPYMTEIHVLSAASNYHTFTLQLATGLPSTDLTWSFLGVDPNKDVWVVNKKETKPYLYRLTAKSKYQAKELVALPFPKLDHRYKFALATNNTVTPATFDLLVIKTSRTSSRSVQFQVVSKPFHDPSQEEHKEQHIGLPVTDDLHSFSWVTTTTPLITNNRDFVHNQERFEENYLCVVKKSHVGLVDKTLVSFFRQSARFQEPRIQLVTALAQTDENFEFLLARNMDMFVIKKANCGTQKVEVHILSWMSKYQTYTLQVGTVLHEVDHTWTFLLAENLDLLCIHKSRTYSERTECLRILCDDGLGGRYTTWSRKTLKGDNETALPETDDSWEFLLAPNEDLYAIHKYGTASGCTEIKVLSAASHWKEITKEFKTALPQTDYNYAFCLTRELNLVAVQKSRFPFSADMASV